MSSESLIYSFLDLFHSQRATTSILWDQMLWERKGSLQQLPTQLRKPGIYSLDFSLLSGRNHRLSSLALSCAAMEERSCWQSQVVPLTCSNASKCICCCFGVLFVSCLAFFFFRHWSDETSCLETLAHRWPPKSVLCCLSRTTAGMC